ncbi:MAG: mcpA 6 [Firmicutes bacterium]|nr:mcpA 6 [Bacillota bacterium]
MLLDDSLLSRTTYFRGGHLVKSLRIKLIVVTVIMFVVALSVLAGLNFWQAQNIIRENVEIGLMASASNLSKQIAATINTSKTELSTIARSPVLISGNHNAIASYLGSEVSNNKEQYEAIVWADPAGNYVDFAGGVGSVAPTPFFQRAIKGETVVFGPDTAGKTGNTVIIVAMPVKSGGQITGVLFGVVNISVVDKTVGGQKVGDTGYAFVLRNDGMPLFHPDKSLINKVNILTDSSTAGELKDVIAKAIQGDSKVMRYSYAGNSKFLAGSPVEGTEWTVCVTVPTQEVTGKLDTFTWISAVTILIVLLIVIVVIFYTASRMTNPLVTLETAANNIARGDLGITKIDVTSQDELGRLARAFEAMVANLRSLVHQIASSSEQVSASSEELTANAEQSAQAANQVATSITSTAQGVDTQVNAVAGALALVKKIAFESQEDANKTRSAVAIVNQAVLAANEGHKAVSSAIGQMTSINQTVNSSAKVVAELGERSKEIGQIVETISGIASQTNLLALNAAIEAARAGEQGKGFAVVAEEVRKLAEQSQEAAKQIAELIHDIQGKTDEAVIAMSNGTNEVKRGTDIVDQAGVSFRNIDNNLKEAASTAQQVADAINQQITLSQQVLSAMEKMDSISRDISDQTQTISAATEEQSASMEEIAASSQYLAQLAEQLNGAVGRFKI